MKTFPRAIRPKLLLISLQFAATCVLPAADEDLLKPGVRGVATRAPSGMKIDGDLGEFKDAFATPTNYFHQNRKNRPAQFLYMWDDEAFYAGLRTVDEEPKQANHAPDNRLWEGDAVEWYFDTRRGEDFRNKQWANGAVHCYWTGLKGTELAPRFCLRPGFLDAIPKIGVEVGARRTATGMEIEFKLPWANFPDFKAVVGEIIALDAEICYSDGGERVDRSFIFGSPLSVQQPASQAQIQLVDAIQSGHWKACGPVLMPMRVDTPWTQKTKAHSVAKIALPVNHADRLGKVVFQLSGLDGELIAEYEATSKTVIRKDGNFAFLSASWPMDIAAPGAHHVTAVVHGKDGGELTRIAPRLVSVGWKSGY